MPLDDADRKWIQACINTASTGVSIIVVIYFILYTSLDHPGFFSRAWAALWK